MLEEKDLVKKLYFNEGFSVEEVAEILEMEKTTVSKMLKGCSQYFILTSLYNYAIRRMSDKEYARLRKKTLSIEPLYMFSMRMEKYLKNNGCRGIPEIYFVLSYFFGQSSKAYDNYKSSFRYLFHLEINKKDCEEKKGEYIVSVGDVKHSVYVEFYKIAAGRSKEDYSKYHSPFSDLKEKEMKKIWFWFIAFVKNSIEYFRDKKIKIKPFCKQIDYGNVLYGYRNEDFFIEQHLEDRDMAKNRELFSKQYEKYNQEIAEKIEENNYINKPTEIISKIIKKTNSESIPNFEFHNIEFEIYKVAVSYFEEETREELKEKADLLTKLLLHYFVFEEESTKEEYFKENNLLSDLTLTEFKNNLEQVKENWAAEGYTSEEIKAVLNYYKIEYLRGLRFSIIDMLLEKVNEETDNDVLNKAIEQLIKIESREKLLGIKRIVREKSSLSSKEIINMIDEKMRN